MRKKLPGNAHRCSIISTLVNTQNLGSQVLGEPLDSQACQILCRHCDIMDSADCCAHLFQYVSDQKSFATIETRRGRMHAAASSRLAW